jgi:hypothetical protein
MRVRSGMGEEGCLHRIKKPLAPHSLIFWDGCCGVDVVLYLEGYNFAIRERFEIEVIYATVIRGLPLQILVIRTIRGE